MRTYSRRTVLSALGAALPFGLSARAVASAESTCPTPVLRFRSFEESVREAFSDLGRTRSDDPVGPVSGFPHRRVEVGDSDLIRTGVQGCHNDRPFAGFPAGHLRIVRTGSEPGAICYGVRLYVSTVDVALTGGLSSVGPSRPLDFASLPPAPIIS